MLASTVLVQSPNFFFDLGIESLSEEHLEFITEYEEYIVNNVNYQISNRHERDDVGQYVRLELIKSYKSRYKYENWDHVVKSIIKRRVGDYKNKWLRNNSRIITETELFKYSDEDNKNLDNLQTENNAEDFTHKIHRKDYIVYLRQCISTSDIFDQWDIEYIEILYELYENSYNLDDETLLEFMGYEQHEIGEFRRKQKNFRKKLIMELDDENRLGKTIDVD